uniref:Macro domain-containing protein n=1 Tax=Lates calcarifer TaxID=8187 RepID=A0A4W6GAI1_LATCA
MFALKQRKLELDNFVLDLLKNEDPEELTKALLTSKGINAAFEINAQRIQLFAASDRDLIDAEDHLRNLLISQHVDVEDSNVLKKPEWQQLVSQLEDANSKSLEIAVCKADMCSYPVNAVVNASNQDLKHNGGLAGALLSAAGPQLQVECDQIVNSRGQLKPGDCVITNAGGKLCCKYVIHAVGPKFDPAKTSKVLAQLKKAVKGSLELAEQRSCISVALPAISRSQGFNLSLCAATIVKHLKKVVIILFPGDAQTIQVRKQEELCSTSMTRRFNDKFCVFFYFCFCNTFLIFVGALVEDISLILSPDF